MNILFCCFDNVSPENGGTERITSSLSYCFEKKYNHKCYLAYEKDCDSCVLTKFEGRIKIKSSQDGVLFEKFICENRIDLIIVQGWFSLVPWIRSFSKVRSVPIVFAHHFAPAFELDYFTVSRLWDVYKQSSSLFDRFKLLLKIAAHPIYFQIKKRMMRNMYKAAYKESDQVVLLSKSFIQDFCKFGNIGDTEKFSVIHNMLSFNIFANLDDLKMKKKYVLIVSRLEEHQKRISVALDIWKLVKEDLSLKDWSLHVLGTGPDEEKYKQKVNDEKIPDVIFYGKTNPIEMYKKSSIFLMTSISEGWGLTLTESMQNGVVPIAFDTYSSLHDIVTNDFDGLIAPKNDKNAYCELLKKLMKNEEWRSVLAKNAVESARRFSIEKISEKWNTLLEMVAEKSLML